MYGRADGMPSFQLTVAVPHTISAVRHFCLTELRREVEFAQLREGRKPLQPNSLQPKCLSPGSAILSRPKTCMTGAGAELNAASHTSELKAEQQTTNS
ncbi:hypothetical protein KCU65_g2, partial [Aureobasidium melanogenum]